MVSIISPSGMAQALKKFPMLQSTGKQHLLIAYNSVKSEENIMALAYVTSKPQGFPSARYLKRASKMEMSVLLKQRKNTTIINNRKCLSGSLNIGATTCII